LKNQLIFLLIFVFIFSKAQKTEICKCDLLKKSNDSLKDSYPKYKFKPISKRAATKPPFDFISIKFLKKFSKSEDIIDSVEIKVNNILNKTVQDTLFGSYQIRDSIERIEYSKKYGDIPRPRIIKTGEINGAIAILYSTKKLFNPKYYLKISNDSGKTWRNYYTGLEGNNNYLLKSNSQFPLWKGKDNIQIEANIVRQITEPLFPSRPYPEYEIVKNNVLITLNLKEILKDSDNDGINDIEEKLVYFTNSLSEDTDNDGINDFEDENPRYKNIDNEFTRLAEAIIFGDYNLTENSDPSMEEFIVNSKTVHEDIQKQMKSRELDFKPREKSFLDRLDFRIIITDDENIRRINTYGERIIFLTFKEALKHLKYSYDISPQQDYSRIFECDDIKGTYVLIFDSLARGETYVITKTSEGWIIRIVNRWMT
jgi:hypothetical protein